MKYIFSALNGNNFYFQQFVFGGPRIFIFFLLDCKLFLNDNAIKKLWITITILKRTLGHFHSNLLYMHLTYRYNICITIQAINIYSLLGARLYWFLDKCKYFLCFYLVSKANLFQTIKKICKH